MNMADNPNVVPVGGGVSLGRLGRFCLMVLSGGFLYPNVCVEGMDLTSIQARYEGRLYNKNNS